MTAFSDLILIGRVVKPQGRRGEVLVEPLSDRPDRFPSLRRAFVPGPDGTAREVRVTSGWPHKRRFVLKIEGVDTIEDAERLRGGGLGIREEDLAPLPDGSYYHHQLTGLSVEDTAGARIGRVEDVMETTGDARVLIVRGDGGETLVPFAADFVRSVDLERARIVIEPPEYVVAS